jgi:acylaminoacyl-peptidase
MKKYFKIIHLFLLLLSSMFIQAQEMFKVMDIFDLKHVSNVQISPSGDKIAYLVNFKNIMTDKSYSNLWIMNSDGSDNQQITKGDFYDFGLSWSNKGDRLAYKSNKKGATKVYIRDINKDTEITISNIERVPGALAWSPDDSQLAFDMFVPKPQETFYKLPKKPDNAEWNAPPVYVDILPYRRDGSGYVKSGKRELFIVTVDGKILSQITNDNFNHRAPVWGSDGQSLILSGLIHEAGTNKPKNKDIYAVDIKTGALTALTNRIGPDENPKVSNNGKWIAYQGYDDKNFYFQSKHMYLMDIDGANSRKLPVPKNFDRSIMDFEWSSDDQGVYLMYEDHGVLQLSFLDMSGTLTPLTRQIGGGYIVDPYTDLGGFSVSNDSRYAFNFGSTNRPPEVGVGKNGQNKKLTNFNEAFFASKKVGKVEEIWLKSSHDQLDIQTWVVKPPNFDPQKKYPMILQIHGGPFLSYGPYFAFDYQFYASNGYIVLYMNPRGSTGYGEKFSQEIHHQFPSHDYDDLMTAVSHMTDQPYVDRDNLFVTGGSGGGVLSAWITSKSNKFKAATIVNPVINWYSFSLYSDNPQLFSYLFPKFPWKDSSHYLKYSPISYVDKVKTPSLLITGESDYRTPIADTEQYYAALKMLGVETVMLRIPNASHEIDNFGSGTVFRLTATLAWFEKYNSKK